MTNLSKTQKVIRWASEKKVRGIGHAMQDLNQTSERAFYSLLNRLTRKGLINVTIEGRKVSLGLTQEAYYNRSSVVVAR